MASDFELDELDDELDPPPPPPPPLDEEELEEDDEREELLEELDEVDELLADDVLEDEELDEVELDELELADEPLDDDDAAALELDDSVGASGFSAPQAASNPPAARAAPLESSFRNSRRRVCSGRSPSGVCEAFSSFIHSSS